MPIQLNEENGGKILVVHVSGKLARYGTKSSSTLSTLPISNGSR